MICYLGTLKRYLILSASTIVTVNVLTKAIRKFITLNRVILQPGNFLSSIDQYRQWAKLLTWSPVNVSQPQNCRTRKGQTRYIYLRQYSLLMSRNELWILLVLTAVILIRSTKSVFLIWFAIWIFFFWRIGGAGVSINFLLLLRLKFFC